ncbi:MAG: sugar transferase, partial [Gallionellaceae bacterium]|nr:sugar transferase [Gallionellaceae bacterium]
MDGYSGRGIVHQHAEAISVVFKLLDALLIVLALQVTEYVLHGDGAHSQYIAISLIAIIGFYIWAGIFGVYQSWRGSPFIFECRALLMVWLADVLMIILVLDTVDLGVVYSERVIYTWLVAMLICLVLWRASLRLVLRKLREQGFNTRSVAIVGAGDTGVRVCETIKCSPWTGLVLAGFYEDRIVADDRVRWEGSIQGDFNDLVNKARKGEIDLVYITLPMSAQLRIMELTEHLADTTTAVYLVPDFFVCNLFHGKWHSLEGMQMVSVFDTPFQGGVSVLKRIQDLVLASLILIAIALPMVIIALVIKLTSPGPIIFKQRRYGVDGREIYVWKFRSMRVIENDDQIVQAKRWD